ncbi:hypothetical protein GGS23DRAFT_617373 [Durotheca rogersii]|uniref:uncharacterized protein n=1 Tax=Durotheca rogersii TaxID=419775 RepID=UPI0022200CEE|nr:uncharacterized protein GGS23DRAFT_617373 [Durotheca rogersii]KAI5866309.1 hypothetical protein GGS23DRAFT_617373 [Durotheca rogersii]
MSSVLGEHADGRATDTEDEEEMLDAAMMASRQGQGGADDDEDGDEGFEEESLSESWADSDGDGSVGASILNELSEELSDYSDTGGREGVGGRGSIEEVLRRRCNQQQEKIRRLKGGTIKMRGEYERKVRLLRAQIRESNARIADLTGERPPPQPWQELLRDYMNGNVELSYKDIYRECCRQENMSVGADSVHPDLREVRPPRQRSQSPSRAGRSPNHAGEQRALSSGMSQQLLSIVLPDISVRPQPLTGRLLGPPRPFPFERLPTELQARIFALVLVRPGRLVHCLSRLDRWEPPAEGAFPAVDGEEPMDPHRRSYLPTGFHIGGVSSSSSPTACVVARARRPDAVLAPLRVCRRWLFAGAHAFYGANTFAFSSLGEWYRFCAGVGRARVERLVHVEIAWRGSLGSLPPDGKPQEMEPAALDDEGRAAPKKPRLRVAPRTRGLTWLARARRLRTLVVHIDERASKRMRRSYEMPPHEDREQDYVSQDRGRESPGGEGEADVFGLMMRRTATQANCRKFRSMRTVHGIDYVYQLRGMQWVRFEERDRKEARPRQAIRDWSFLRDVNTVVTIPKPPGRARRCELENLTPLSGLAGWRPTDEDWRLVKMFYDETPAGAAAQALPLPGDFGSSEPDMQWDLESQGRSQRSTSRAPSRRARDRGRRRDAMPGTEGSDDDSEENSSGSGDDDDSESDSDEDWDDHPVRGLSPPVDATGSNPGAGQAFDLFDSNDESEDPSLRGPIFAFDPDEFTDSSVEMDTDSDEDGNSGGYGNHDDSVFDISQGLNTHQSTLNATTIPSLGPSQEHNRVIDRMDVDDDDSNRSSSMFVPSGSGPSLRGADAGATPANRSSTSGLVLSSGSGPGLSLGAGSGSRGPSVMVDLTHEPTGDEGGGRVSHASRSSSGAEAVVQSEAGSVTREFIDLTMFDDDESDSDMSSDSSDTDPSVKYDESEEGGESSVDHDPSDGDNYRSPSHDPPFLSPSPAPSSSSSSKRSRGSGASFASSSSDDGDDEAPSSKRNRHEGPHESGFLSALPGRLSGLFRK